MRHVVMFSGGIGSWAAAKRVAEQHGTDNLTLLFTDTLIEDVDTYRFLYDAAANVGGVLEVIADGRTPWEVFRDVRFLANSRVDPCSRILKRDLADMWLRVNRDPSDTTVYVGIDWTEIHRFERLAPRKLPWVYRAPMCEPPYLTKDEMHEWAEREGLRKQRLYVLGMPHANCGGGCVKMGVGGFARLYYADPCRYAEWEANEEKLRAQLGDVSILRDRAGGTARPLTLRALRERIEGSGTVDMFDIGGCGCFADDAVPPVSAAGGEEENDGAFSASPAAMRYIHSLEREIADRDRALAQRKEPAATEQDVEGLDALVGLHEGIEIIYVVDGYEATLTKHDGATSAATAHGDTVMDALRALAAAIRARSQKEG